MRRSRRGKPSGTNSGAKWAPSRGMARRLAAGERVLGCDAEQLEPIGVGGAEMLATRAAEDDEMFVNGVQQIAVCHLDGTAPVRPHQGRQVDQGMRSAVIGRDCAEAERHHRGAGPLGVGQRAGQFRSLAGGEPALDEQRRRRHGEQQPRHLEVADTPLEVLDRRAVE